jgi:hypothetical protein
MTGGVCSATCSVKECFCFDIDVKGGERRVRNVSVTKESLNVECRWSNAGESSLNASVAINAKGGDCWQFQLTESKLAYTCH